MSDFRKGFIEGMKFVIISESAFVAIIGITIYIFNKICNNI